MSNSLVKTSNHSNAYWITKMHVKTKIRSSMLTFIKKCIAPLPLIFECKIMPSSYFHERMHFCWVFQANHAQCDRIIRFVQNLELLGVILRDKKSRPKFFKPTCSGSTMMGTSGICFMLGTFRNSKTWIDLIADAE